MRFGGKNLKNLSTEATCCQADRAGIPSGVTVSVLGRLRLTLLTVDRAMAGWIR